MKYDRNFTVQQNQPYLITLALLLEIMRCRQRRPSIDSNVKHIAPDQFPPITNQLMTEVSKPDAYSPITRLLQAFGCIIIKKEI